MPEGTSAGHRQAPVRGTQSFVGVMSEVWGRPSLTALEILWRWCAGFPILALAGYQLLNLSRRVHLDTAALQSITVFQPVAAFHSIGLAADAVLPALKPVAFWCLPICFVAWLMVAAWGRTLVLRRYDRRLRSRRMTFFALGGVRAALLAIVWIAWFELILWDGRVAIMGPAAVGSEPNIVLYAAILICGTLFLYVLWAICSWPFHLAPLLAMAEHLGPWAALRASFRSKAVRGKLIEINLVMNIVKIALLVLAMVFSASPLPFSSVETQTFLVCWWAVMIVLYLAASDYFHVVRSAAYLSLWRDLGLALGASDSDVETETTAERFTL